MSLKFSITTLWCVSLQHQISSFNKFDVADLEIFFGQGFYTSEKHLVIFTGHTGIPGLWTQELDAGLWMLDSGRWTLDSGLWTLHSGQWTLNSGRWTLDSGRWTLNSGRWTLDAELRTLNARLWKSKTVQSFGNNGSISITSFLNSTLINIFGHFRYEHLSTVYSFQATLSNHLKISKIWWCGEGRSTWNGLIWSSVSVKAQTMRYFWQLIFFIFSKHVVEQKKWFIWIRTLNSCTKKDRFREFIAAIFCNLIKTSDI